MKRNKIKWERPEGFKRNWNHRWCIQTKNWSIEVWRRGPPDRGYMVLAIDVPDILTVAKRYSTEAEAKRGGPGAIVAMARKLIAAIEGDAADAAGEDGL